MKIAEWGHICSLISRMWPNDPVKPDTGEVWFPLVADLDYTDVAAAVRTLRLDPAMRWAPTPGHLRDACNPTVDAWTSAIPEIGRRLSRSQTRNDNGDYDAIAEYIRSLGNPARGIRWDPSNPTVRAQLRDWWQDHHRRQAHTVRRQIAAGSTPALKSAS